MRFPSRRGAFACGCDGFEHGDTVEVPDLPRFVHAVRVTDGEGRAVRATVRLHTTKHGRSTLVVEVDPCTCPMSVRKAGGHSLACPGLRHA